MNDLGLLHGDAHFQNILTDGQRRSTPYPWREIEELERAGCDV
jgi:streptomycin 6-kinase